jgi:hypothetical protein
MYDMDVGCSLKGSTASTIVGVTMIKPTTSYYYYFFRRHNRICGLAVAFKNNFFGGLPALPKKIPKSRCLGRAAPNQLKCQ